MSKTHDILNATETLNKNLDRLIDVFVMFYGEEKREEITAKFNKMMFIGYQDSQDVNTLISKEKEDFTNKILSLTFDKLEIPIEKQKIIIEASNLSNLDYIEFSPLNLLKINIDDYRLGPESRLEKGIKERYELFKKYLPELSYDDFKNKNIKEEDLKKVPSYILSYLNFDKIEIEFNKKFNDTIVFLKKIYPEINKDNFNEYLNSGKLDKLEKLSYILDELKEKYDKYIKDNYGEIIRNNETLKNKYNKLKEAYFKQYVEEFKELLTEEDKKIFENAENEIISFTYSVKGIEVLFGKSFSLDSSISYFSEEADKILDDIEASEYRKTIIKENRIKYFNYRGINLGSNYEDYINNSQVQKIWPNKELINRLEERKDYYHNKLNNDYYSSIPFYQEVRKIIENLNLLDKEYSFNPNAYLRQLTCVNPNIIMKDGKYDLYSLVLIYSNLSEYADISLIHELNHLYELSLLNVENNSYQVITGWDYLNGNINNSSINQVDTINVDNAKRQYELFSEIINEMIAQEITEMMHEKDIYIFNTKENAKIKGGTSYEHTIPLVRDFYNTFKKEIIESRNNNNIQIILDKVGKVNFDQLNKLFYIFNEHFSGLRIMQVYNDLRNEKDTKETKIYNELIEASKQILENMKEYSNNHQISINM